MKGHEENLKEKFNYALKEANYVKLDQKEEKDKVLNAKERMGKTILEISTLKSSTRLNMQLLRYEHYKALNPAKDNVTTETIEELGNLRQILEDKNVILWKLARIKTCLWKN